MEAKYTGPDAIAAESVYDSGYEDCEKALKPKIEALQSKLNKLTYAAKRLSFLNQCELEGISSGMPTPKEWLEAFDNLDALLDNSPEPKGK